MIDGLMTFCVWFSCVKCRRSYLLPFGYFHLCSKRGRKPQILVWSMFKLPRPHGPLPRVGPAASGLRSLRRPLLGPWPLDPHPRRVSTPPRA